jgi:hypothetical protein
MYLKLVEEVESSGCWLVFSPDSHLHQRYGLSKNMYDYSNRFVGMRCLVGHVSDPPVGELNIFVNASPCLGSAPLWRSWEC